MVRCASVTVSQKTALPGDSNIPLDWVTPPPLADYTTLFMCVIWCL